MDFSNVLHLRYVYTGNLRSVLIDGRKKAESIEKNSNFGCLGNVHRGKNPVKFLVDRNSTESVISHHEVIKKHVCVVDFFKCPSLILKQMYDKCNR